MITLWGRRNSMNVQKVLWALAELDLPFERVNVGGSFGGNDKPEFKAMNPMGLIPVIKDGDIVMFESNAIVRNLAARYGHTGLQPKDSISLAAAEQWMEWTHNGPWPQASTLFMQLVRTAPANQNPAAIEAAIKQLHRLLPMVEKALTKSRFLAGDELTFADIPLGVMYWRIQNVDWDRPVLSNLQRWYERLQERIPYRQWIMLPLGKSPQEWLANERANA